MCCFLDVDSDVGFGFGLVLSLCGPNVLIVCWLQMCVEVCREDVAQDWCGAG